MEIEVKIKKLKKHLEKRLEKYRLDCVENAYDPKKEDWNPKHFKYCEADVICKQLDLLNELESSHKSNKEKEQ